MENPLWHTENSEKSSGNRYRQEIFNLPGLIIAAVKDQEHTGSAFSFRIKNENSFAISKITPTFAPLIFP